MKSAEIGYPFDFKNAKDIAYDRFKRERLVKGDLHWGPQCSESRHGLIAGKNDSLKMGMSTSRHTDGWNTKDQISQDKYLRARMIAEARQAGIN